MRITIEGKEYELKYSFRSFIIYENIKGKTFEPTTLEDIIVFFYATVLSSMRDYSYKFDDFMDLIDENPMLVTEFSNWLVSQNEGNQSISSNDTASDKKEESNKPKKSKSRK